MTWEHYYVRAAVVPHGRHQDPELMLAVLDRVAVDDVAHPLPAPRAAPRHSRRFLGQFVPLDLNELTKLGPVPIIADPLGYQPSTIERHAIGAASAYAQHIGAVRQA